jgi:hypothetical protein
MEIYEFTGEQNKLMTNLSQRLRFVGLAFTVLGILQSFLSFINSTGFSIAVGIAGGLLFISIGVLMVRASVAFRSIVETEGHDIENLMQALHELLSMYNLQFWSLVVSGALILIVIGQAVFSLSLR